MATMATMEIIRRPADLTQGVTEAGVNLPLLKQELADAGFKVLSVNLVEIGGVKYAATYYRTSDAVTDQDVISVMAAHDPIQTTAEQEAETRRDSVEARAVSPLVKQFLAMTDAEIDAFLDNPAGGGNEAAFQATYPQTHDNIKRIARLLNLLVDVSLPLLASRIDRGDV